MILHVFCAIKNVIKNKKKQQNLDYYMYAIQFFLQKICALINYCYYYLNRKNIPLSFMLLKKKKKKKKNRII